MHAVYGWSTSLPLRIRDLEYHFGFAIAPFNITEEDGGKESGDIAGDQEAAKKARKIREKDRQHQVELIDASKEIIRHQRKKKERTGVKEMVEAWSLADTEAWHFVRAFRRGRRGWRGRSGRLKRGGLRVGRREVVGGNGSIGGRGRSLSVGEEEMGEY